MHDVAVQRRYMKRHIRHMLLALIRKNGYSLIKVINSFEVNRLVLKENKEILLGYLHKDKQTPIKRDKNTRRKKEIK